jgi:hypothetical protein
MTTSLSELEFLPYVTPEGQVTDRFDGKVGLYAIFDQGRSLQYIGYSRDVSLSLRQHLVRCPDQCYWLKVTTVDRPSRTILEEMQQQWVTENGTLPEGNGDKATLWNQPIDAKVRMTEAEQTDYGAADDLGKIKTLKKVARRVEADILAQLQGRGVTEEFRFDPKLKEEGLLGLK